jgi:nitrogen regulatory protein P-II 1
MELDEPVRSGERKMVFVQAYIKPFKLDDVKECLEELGVGGITVTEVLQTSVTRGRGRSFGSGPSHTDLVPKIKIEVAVPRQQAERVIEAICFHGSAGKSEDGQIVVETVEGTVRIRTGDEGEDALSS